VSFRSAVLLRAVFVLSGTGEVSAVSTHWGIHEDVYCAVRGLQHRHAVVLCAALLCRPW
jgi:hypothetical protein